MKNSSCKNNSLWLKPDQSRVNKINIKPDGTIKTNHKLIENGGGDLEGIIYKTDYGFKIISLAPDVKKVYIEVTTLCNFDCTTCIRNSWEDKLSKMGTEVFDLIIEQLKELPNLEWVHFGGFGEPMSHPHIFEMIKMVKDLGLKAEMISNGSLLTKEAAAKLVELGLDKLFISMDGPDEEVFNDIRKGADFVSVIGNIKGLNEVKRERKVTYPELAFEFVAMKKNYHKLPQLVNMLSELNARYLLVTNVMPYCEELKDEVVYDLDDKVPVFDKVSSLLISVRAKLPHMKLRTQRNCKFIEDKALTITCDGNVAPCYALMHSYTCFIYGREKKIKSYYLGNVKENTLKDIWSAPEYASFRATVKDFQFPSCTDCKLVEGCNYTDNNEMDCWGNSPSCSECLWARGIIVCP